MILVSPAKFVPLLPVPDFYNLFLQTAVVFLRLHSSRREEVQEGYHFIVIVRKAGPPFRVVPPTAVLLSVDCFAPPAGD